jgi:alpha-glucosidase
MQRSVARLAFLAFTAALVGAACAPTGGGTISGGGTSGSQAAGTTGGGAAGTAAGGRGGSGTAGVSGVAGTGPAGTTGAAGATGSAGTPGAAGTTGSAGATGAAGTTGSAGTSGAAGTTGGGGRAGSAGGGAGSAGSGVGGGAGTTGGTGGSGAGGDTSASWTIASPGNTVRARVELADKGGMSGYPAGARLYYTVDAGGPSAFARVLEDSPLGITRSDQGFVDGLALDTAGGVTVVDETYTMVTGKKSNIRNHANERVLSFRAGASNNRVQLVIRAYDTGFAFRYRFPEQSSAQQTVTGETTGFKIPASSRAWLLPYDAAGDYTPAYESYWRHDVAVGTAAPGGTVGWCFPAVFRTPTNHWLLLSDTEVNGSYFAAHLAASPASNVYRIEMPRMNEADNVGAVNPTSTPPWSTAWRMVVAGATPAAVVESTLATDLAAPSTIADTSWIRPGRASWSWWDADGNPTNYAANTPYIDLAQQMTWEYSLIDHGWHQMAGGGTWQNLQSYAASRNVGLLLWYNSGGNHNHITLTPRDRMNDATRRRSELQTISAAGIKGIKVDFFHGDKPWLMQYYLDILRDAAEYRLLVNFHGSTIPRGWQRTYPNLMTAEAARGSEWYKYEAGYPADAARRNTIFPFTRNAISSMDYTPVTFTNHANAHLTTYGHELALAVVFESGIQHFADRPRGYSGISTGARTFLQQVPVAWDDTRYVQGTPGQFVVLARRKGTVWYLAGIEGDNQARDLTINLGFLGAGSYTATVIADGTSNTTFGERSESVTASGSLAVSMRARGGFVVRLAPP